MTDTDETKLAKRPRGRWLRRLAIGCATCVLVLGLGLAVTLVALVGTTLSAPDWLRARITEKINAGLGGLALEFRDVSVVVQEDWVPRLALRDARLMDGSGAALLGLSELQVTVAPGPLLQGKVQPGTIRLSGARLTLRRGADGVIDLSLGDEDRLVRQAPTLAALIAQVDRLFQRPQFAALERLRADNLSLRFEDARAGRAWSVDGGRVSLTRDGDSLAIRSDLALLGARGYATTMAMTYAGRIGETAARFTVDFEDMPAGDIAGQAPALSWLDALEAPISGQVRAEVDPAGFLGPLDARLEIGQGVLRPMEGTPPVAFTSAQSRFSYDPGARMIRFDSLEIDSQWGRTRIDGRARLSGMEDGWPDALVSQFQVRALAVNPMALYETPVIFEGASLDMRLTLAPFAISIGEMRLADQGRNLLVRGEVRARDDGWHVSADARLAGIAPERALALWPESLEPKTRTWIAENVRDATLRNIRAALRVRPGQAPDVALGFDFEDLTTRFVKDVPPIEAARGHATIEDNRFVIFTQEGHVTASEGGRIDIAGSSFDIPDIRIKRGPGRVRLRTRGRITAGLSLLDEKPFRYMQKAGRPVRLAEGRARVEGTLDFLVKDDLQPEEVAFDLSGAIHDARSARLIEGRVITAPELALEADTTQLKISGAGRIGQVPFEGRFTLPLVRGSKGRALAEGRIELSQRFADEFGIDLPPGSIAGATRAPVRLDFAPDAPPVFELSSDLAGLALHLAPLGWSLAAGETGQLEVAGALGKPPAIDRLSLDAGGLRAQGAVRLGPGGQLEKANFPRVRLGTWLDAPVELVGRGPGVQPLVRVTGGRIDLRQTALGGPARGGGRADAAEDNDSAGGGSAQPPQARDRPLELRLDRLQVSDTIALTAFTADLDMAGPEGSFAGRLNGGSPVSGRVVPREGRAGFRISGRDAGGVLRSAGLLNQARDGSLELGLIPGKGDGVYDGRLEIENLRVKDAPAMAALLNALSIVGLLEQLGGEGIYFNHVEAEFQLAPERLTIYSGSAVGASMGLSFEGYYWPEEERMDVQGVISPVYAVNMLGGLFSRQGEGFVGFNYALKGPKNAPRVTVNPLSVFAPGVFRELFRRPPPPRGDAPDAAAPADPQQDIFPTGQPDR